MKSSFVAHGLMALFVAFASLSNEAQSRDVEEDVTPLLRVDSAFVWVPVLVKTKNGRTLSSPDVSRFRLLDNGTPEKVTIINTDGLPISLVILMQTGGSARHFLSSYSDLPELIGGSVHEITLVTFDSRVEEVWHFPAQKDGVEYALRHQHSGDNGAAIKDAVAFGVRQLQAEPGRFRRVVLLLSQGRGLGSSTSGQLLLEQLGTSSTVVYSLRFPSGETHAGRVRETKHTGAMEEASKRMGRALDDQTAEEVASLTGGADYQFDDQRGFNSAMLETLSDFRHGITLGFQPSRLEAGFHRIEIGIDTPKLQVTARRAYWLTCPE